MIRNVKNMQKNTKNVVSQHHKLKKNILGFKVFFRKFLYCFLTFDLKMNEFFRYMTHQVNYAMNFFFLIIIINQSFIGFLKRSSIN